MSDPLPAERPLTFAQHVLACFDEAIDVWGTSVRLSVPVAWTADKSTLPENEPLAYIDMRTRQIVINYEKLHQIGALGSLTSVLAHEIGHHTMFPHTMGEAAALEVLQRRLLPFYKPSLTNLFFDLQVNEFVGRTHADQLTAVYHGFCNDTQLSDMFAFYVAVYEELWTLPENLLVGQGNADRLDAALPAWRAEARMFAQTLYSLPDTYVQFAYFLSVFSRYLPADGTGPGDPMPMSADAEQPSADDYEGALGHNPAIDRAIEEARARGWIERSDAEAAAGGDPLTTIDRLASGRPGKGGGELKKALVLRHYHRLVDQHLIEIPPSPDQPVPDPFIPTTLEEWEWGDSPTAIDWTASVLAQGALAVANPLKRTLEPDEPDPRGQAIPALEIYLDTSGSMPNPSQAINAMTLAAQILAAAAIRHGGIVRAIVYSDSNPLVTEWIQSEETAREALLYYIGGGTTFPSDVLVRHAEERPDAIRVLISDGDFVWNMGDAASLARTERGIDKSSTFVALLHVWGEQAPPVIARLALNAKFRFVHVKNLSEFGKMATDLADALFGRQ